MPKPQLILFAVSALAASSVRAQPATPPLTSAPYSFLPPWNDASRTATDNSDLNPAPLTDKQRLSVKNGHFYDATNRRVRLVGGNVTSTAPFSDREHMAQVSARMHKLGFNVMRLHHIDASWANPNIFGANRDNAKDSNARVDPASLRLLDSTIAEFKQHGIYTNLNLHVSRQPSPGDNFPDTDKLPGLGKVVAYFEPRFIEMQKDYARQILDHVNPFTGMRNADDPALAFVEINNEDSLTGEAWTGSLQGMPPHYRGVLQTGWNAWLQKHYASTSALQTAWSSGSQEIGPNLLPNATFADANGWYLEQQGEAKGELSSEDIAPGSGPNGRALRIKVQTLPDANWKLQLSQTGLNLRNGELYTLSGWAKADAPRASSVYVAMDQAPWSQLGGNSSLSLSTEWKPFRTVFLARGAVPNHSRVTFTIGEAKSDVLLADLKLQTGAIADIPALQTLEAKTLDLPALGGMTPRQAQDWMSYLSDVERDYADGMRAFLKNTVKTRALVTCSQASYGGWAGVRRESGMDFIDSHAYWQHPNFPRVSWDAKDWNIPNTAMTDDPDGGTFFSLAAYRVAGKPFTVSEYNHPAPNDYASETVPLIFALAAAQDWDGIYLFEYAGERNAWKPGKIRGFFAVDTDPNKIAPLPVAARAFLTGAIPPFSTRAVLNVPRESLLGLASANQGAGPWQMQGDVMNAWRQSGLSRRDLLSSRLEMRLVNGNGAPTLARVNTSGAKNPGGVAASTATPVAWEFNGRAGVLQSDAPSAKTLVGRFAGTSSDTWNAGPRTLGELQITNAQSVNGWGVLNVVARDGKALSASRSILVSAMNRAENQNMGWNADRTSVSDQWGDGPPQMLPFSASLSLQTRAKSAQVYALDATGKRGALLKSQLKNGVLSFRVGDAPTPWYEVVCVQPMALAKTPVKVAAR